ncbi:MAG: hypothetical protein OXU51_17540 [Candidatus Poribacteria bacterium]|nr:hypothetical protein [Candidatus Poribacteria bacterium]
MPIFRVEEDTLIIAQETNVELEQHIEIWIENSPWAVIQGELVLWIDRQASAQDEEGTIYPDLLGVDSEGDLVVVEFKRRQTPRDVVAQLLEYAAWANELPLEQIHEIADAYFEKRDEFRGKTFPDAFREVFDIPETDELPPLNRKLRLFVVAEEIHPRVARVCRFLRTSYKMDVSCIAVSKFQTESGDEIVSTETKVGDEEIDTPKTRQQGTLQTSRWSGDIPVNQVVWKAVQEFTDGDANKTFAIKDIKAVISNKYPDFNMANLGPEIGAGCVNNFSRYNSYSTTRDRYWRIDRGKYRLYDPEKDKVEKADE